MDWSDQPAGKPAHSPPPGSPFAASDPAPESFSPAPAASPASASPDVRGRSHLGGARRTIATALLAVGLLTVGGVAVVFAADPSASPEASAQPSTGGGADVAPDATSRPHRDGAAGRSSGDCDKAEGGSGGGSTTPDASEAPSTDEPTTVPSPEL
jgi:hypothetical protein